MQITVLGAGSWGTALALLLTNKGHSVSIWSPETDVVAEITSSRTNYKYLPGHVFSGEIAATESMPEAVAGAEMIIMAVPSSAVREVARKLSEACSNIPPLVNAGKGLESSTGMRLSQVISEEIPGAGQECVVMSGPNLAVEVARQVPTATVVASIDQERAARAQDVFSCRYLRVYRSSDVAGVELAGALKNVLAIGAGISDGMGYGDNTKATLVTRGLVEMMRLGEALGAQPKTFMGLAGIGDLITTCSSRLSRNLRFGIALGQGKSLNEAMAEVRQVVEGVPACKAAYSLASSIGICAPITEQLYKVLFEGKPPREAVADLMLREPKEE
ncbi:MAG: NAD(P)-dependent glycerol-3-phosphate dehydrogenase [Armatimonadetes bacterium]|nr:NAD(P)-dependent glycerol-3-phosphate dehydrogenase [Armatimonadota bacterium]